MGKRRASELTGSTPVHIRDPNNPVRVYGIDLSLNHSAVVELCDGQLGRFWYVTSIVGSAKRDPSRGTRLHLPKTADPQQYQVWRLQWWDVWLNKLFSSVRPRYLGIEDYALGGHAPKGKDGKPGAQHGGHYKGELGGCTRVIAMSYGAQIRLHEPNSIKMFVAHNGHAKKPQIEKAVFDRWGLDFSEYNSPQVKGKKENRQTSEDLADAAGIAQMIWTEVQLRRGILQLIDLGHPKEIQVFQRCTKRYPISLLGRDWIEPLTDERWLP